jgi:hypothetical protein
MRRWRRRGCRLIVGRRVFIPKGDIFVSKIHEMWEMLGASGTCV